LARFYADAKAAFTIFDRQVKRSQTFVQLGYAGLLGDLHDPTALKLIVVLSTMIDIPQPLLDLLRLRAFSMAIDFNELRLRAAEMLAVWATPYGSEPS
jgi:hypothetical protein